MIDKYSELASTHIFYPFAIETAGTWHEMVIELTQEISRRITTITEDTRETPFLFQRFSMALQRGNALSFHNCRYNHNFVLVILTFVFNPRDLYY